MTRSEPCCELRGEFLTPCQWKMKSRQAGELYEGWVQHFVAHGPTLKSSQKCSQDTQCQWWPKLAKQVWRQPGSCTGLSEVQELSLQRTLRVWQKCRTACQISLSSFQSYIVTAQHENMDMFQLQIPLQHAVIFEKSPLVHNLLLYFETLLSACNFRSIISAPFRCRINLRCISRTAVLNSFSLEHFVDIEIPFMIWGRFFTRSAVILCDCHSEQGKPQGLTETWSPFPDIFSRD